VTAAFRSTIASWVRLRLTASTTARNFSLPTTSSLAESTVITTF
jgi:hypothetical protein